MKKNGLASFRMRNGFTLVELLVVIAILSVALTLVLTIFTRTLRGGNKSQVISSIKQNGQAVLDLMDKTVRSSDRVVCTSDTGDTMVVVKNGLYTKYKFLPPTATENGYIQQEEFNLPTEPGDRDESGYLRDFELGVCSDPFTNPQIITDTNAQSGASINCKAVSGTPNCLTNPIFVRTKQAGFKDQITIQFEIKSGVGAAQATAGTIDPVNFKTTIFIR